MIKKNDPDSASADDLEQTVVGTAFPFLVLGGIAFSQGAFILTSVKDKEDKLRYLLNFAGMSSFSYWIGMFLADIILYLIPITLLIIFSFILSIKQFSDNAGALYLIFVLFGMPFIAMIYLTGFMFSKSEAAFKYGLLIVILVTGVSMIFTIWSSGWMAFVAHTNPFICAGYCISQIMTTDPPTYDIVIL